MNFALRRSPPVADAAPQPVGAGELPDERIEAPPPKPAKTKAKTQPKLGRVSPRAAAVVAAVGGVSVLAMWFVLYALVLSGLQEGHTQHVLYSRLRYELSQATTPLGGVIQPGEPVAYLQAPSIGLQAVIVEGTSSADLASGPGHLPTTPLPGQPGNSQIFGRSVMFGAPFGSVHKLKPGATITVTTGQGASHFRVLDVRGPGDPLPTATQIGSASMTLVTSAGNGWRGGWAPDHVIYADATLVSHVQPFPTGRPIVAPSVDNAMAGDTNVLVPLVLWLQALVAVGAGVAWAYTRWTGWQIWVAGLPAILALLWVCASNAVLLLPNLT